MGEEEPKIPQGRDKEALIKRLDRAFALVLDSSIKEVNNELAGQIGHDERQKLQKYLEGLVNTREKLEDLRKPK